MPLFRHCRLAAAALVTVACTTFSVDAALAQGAPPSPFGDTGPATSDDDGAARLARIAAATGRPAPIPPGARYVEACSRMFGERTAVFTFDLELSAEARAVWEEHIATQARDRDPVKRIAAGNAAFRALETGAPGDALRRARAYLASRGHARTGGSESTDLWFRPALPGKQALLVYLFTLNAYCPAAMPSGPTLYVSLDRF